MMLLHSLKHSILSRGFKSQRRLHMNCSSLHIVWTKLQQLTLKATDEASAHRWHFAAQQSWQLRGMMHLSIWLSIFRRRIVAHSAAQLHQFMQADAPGRQFNSCPPCIISAFIGPLYTRGLKKHQNQHWVLVFANCSMKSPSCCQLNWLLNSWYHMTYQQCYQCRIEPDTRPRLSLICAGRVQRSQHSIFKDGCEFRSSCRAT